MRTFYAFVFVLLAQQAMGQEQVSAAKAERVSHFYAGPSVGFEFMNINNYTSELGNNYSVVYKGLPSLRMGIDLTYKQTKQFLINAGAFVSQKNFTRTETRSGNEVSYYESQFKSRYYEIQGGATYNFLIGRLDLGAYANVNFAFLNKAKEQRDTETGNSFEFDIKGAQNKILTIIEPGLNINYNMTYRLSLNIKAGYRLYTQSMNMVDTYRNSGILLQPGLFYMF